MRQVLGLLREVEARGVHLSLADEDLRLQGLRLRTAPELTSQFKPRRPRILAAYRDEMERAHGI